MVLTSVPEGGGVASRGLGLVSGVLYLRKAGGWRQRVLGWSSCPVPKQMMGMASRGAWGGPWCPVTE